MMSKNRRTALGAAAVGAGIVLLLGQWGFFRYWGGKMWPMLVLIAGLALHVLYFNRWLSALALVPGGMLLTYAMLFFYCATFGWGALGVLWPVFPFGAAVGLFELYLFGRRREALAPAIVLAVVSAIGLAVSLLVAGGATAVALVLIAAGVYLLVGKRNTRAW